MSTRRAGKTLIEMLLLISILTVATSLAATTLVALFKTDRQVRRDLDQLTTLARLSSRFRTDVHASQSCQVGPTCDLVLTDGRIVRYAFAKQRVSREVRRGDAVEHRDAFLLADTAIARFDRPQDEGRLVRLTISAADSSDKSFLTPVRPAVIEAAIGLSLRKQEPNP